jgi:hypothetical protein
VPKNKATVHDPNLGKSFVEGYGEGRPKKSSGNEFVYEVSLMGELVVSLAVEADLLIDMLQQTLTEYGDKQVSINIFPLHGSKEYQTEKQLPPDIEDAEVVEDN